MSLWFMGVDGKANFGMVFVNWDLIYENGSLDNASFEEKYNTWDYGKSRTDDDFDVSAWLGHVDVGVNLGSLKLTGTVLYASGDDDGADSDFDGFMAVDIDRTDSITLMEGGYTDDDYYTEKDYMLDKGLWLFKGAADYKVSKKLTVGGALMYMMTAEDIEYSYVDENGVTQNESDDSLGIEVNAYLKYKIYDNLEFAGNAGYLFADDAMDFWEVDKDGSSDEDIFISTARVRYKF
jgi:hypothetical protein